MSKLVNLPTLVLDPKHLFKKSFHKGANSVRTCFFYDSSCLLSAAKNLRIQGILQQVELELDSCTQELKADADGTPLFFVVF